MNAAPARQNPRAPKEHVSEMTEKNPDKILASKSQRERRAMIAALVDDGLTRREIAKVLDISPQAVSRIAGRAGIPLGIRGGTGRVGAHVPRRLKANIRTQAEAAGISVSAYVARVLRVVCEDPIVARRTLGRDALPARRIGASR